MTSHRLRGDVPSAYAKGYSESIKRQLETVPLTDKLKCKICKSFRNINRYSNRQLDIFRNAFVVQGKRALTTGHATCRGCTSGQVMELRCCVCDQVKGLDEFAINQRKEHEFARCLVCVQGHKDAEPVIDENKLLAEGDLLSTTQGTITHFGWVYKSPTSYGPCHGSSFADVTDNVPSGGGVWIEPERHEINSSRRKGLSSYNNSQRNLAAFNANSIHSGWASFGVQRSEAAASVLSDGREGKFAKVKVSLCI
ncbi:Stc1 domain-containing protein [Aspergillus tetrazonus]